MRFLICLFSFLFFSCSIKNKNTIVIFRFIPFYHGTLYLEKVPAENSTATPIDSATLDFQTDKLKFEIPAQEESVFRLRIKGQPIRIYFINDKSFINIYSNNPSLKTYNFNGDTYNNDLRIFLDSQRKYENQIDSFFRKADIDNRTRNASSLFVDSIRKLEQRRDLDFLDTTRSPAAFLVVYNRYQWEEKILLQKKVIVKAQMRFAGHEGVNKLCKETLAYLSIFEQEFKVGDKIPDVMLPDQHGLPFQLSSLKGKFVLIDFWSTWCPPCLAYMPIKNQLKKEYAGRNFEIVSIAIDDEIENWKQIINTQSAGWPQLIDRKMWRGDAIMKFKIDSIPFNFLVGPDGKILSKAIPADSLHSVVAKLIQ